MEQSIVMESEAPPPPEMIRLARKQVLRYSNLRGKALGGEPGYRLEEINELLWLWDGVLGKGGRWELLSFEQRRAVLDAVETCE